MKYLIAALCALCLTVGSTVRANDAPSNLSEYLAPNGSVSLEEMQQIIHHLSAETDVSERSYWQQFHEGTLRAEEIDTGVFEVQFVDAGGGIMEVLIDINF